MKVKELMEKLSQIEDDEEIFNESKNHGTFRYKKGYFRD